MDVFAFIGFSKCGKTLLIKKLISEFKKRGFSVAAIKHCPHGFDIDPKTKDSWIFFNEGANPVGLDSPQKLAVFRVHSPQLDIKRIATEYMKNVDIVFVEGNGNDNSLKKIQVMRQGISEKLKSDLNESIAVVSDIKLDLDKPVFHPSQISQIADFIESKFETQKSSVSLKVDGTSIPTNRFVQKIFINTIMGMISSLDGINENPERITITLSLANKK